jgi:large subunit ribosomal protein L10
VAVPSASNVAQVEAIKGRFDEAVAALLTEYRGLTVSELAELRTALRGSSTEYKVLKNTLTSLAVKANGHDDLVQFLEGPTAIAFVKGDPVQAAKDLADFARTHPALVVKGGLLEGRVMPADEVRKLATLESREVLLAKVAGLLQAQLQQAVTLLAAPLRQVATMTAALRDKREGEAPAEAHAAEAAEAASAEAPAAGAASTEAPAAEAEATEAPAAAEAAEEAPAAEAEEVPAADESAE